MGGQLGKRHRATVPARRRHAGMERSPIDRRRGLRQRATDAEQILWRALRQKRIGAKWRRQHSIASFIVDLYCASAQLVVELDGGQHYDPEQLAYDARRTQILESLGLRVVRFTNLEVLQKREDVLREIYRLVEG